MGGTRDSMRGIKKIIIFISILIVILSIVFVGLIISISNQNVFVGTCKRIISFIDGNYDSLLIEKEQVHKAKINGKFNVNFDIKDETLKEELDKYNGMQIDFDLSTDIQQEISRLMLGIKEKDKELLNGDVVVDSENLYVNVKDITDGYISYNIGQNIYESINTFEEDNNYLLLVKEIYDNVKEDFIKIIEKQEVSKEKVKININGKEKSVIKNSILLNDKLKDEISLLVYKQLIVSEEYMKYVENMVEKTKKQYEAYGWDSYTVTKEEYIEDLQREIEKLEKKLEENKYEQENNVNNSIVLNVEERFNIYTTQILNNPIIFEFETKRGNDKAEIVALTYMDKYIGFNKSEYNDDKLKEDFNINLFKENNDKWKVGINTLEGSENEKIFEANCEYKKNESLNIDYVIPMEEENITGHINVTIIDKKDGLLDYASEVLVSYNENKVQLVFELKADSNSEIIIKGYKDNVVNYEELSEEDMNNILQKFQSKFDIEYSDDLLGNSMNSDIGLKIALSSISLFTVSTLVTAVIL